MNLLKDDMEKKIKFFTITSNFLLAALFCQLASILFLTGCSLIKDEVSQKPNVLFIVVDDMRPELGCYGNSTVISPNMDRIAEHGLLFERAYCQFPVCGPSRCSVLSGLYPTRTRYPSNFALLDEQTPDIVSLPEYFKKHGYYTISNGKVFHDHGNVIDGIDAWSEIPWEAQPGYWVWLEDENRQYTYPGHKRSIEYKRNPGPSWEAADVPDDAYPTGLLTNKTISDLHRLKDMNKPFFLAVGYRKPHLPVNAPKKYWDLYDKKQFKLADNFNKLFNLPKEAITKSPELRRYRDIPDNGPISEQTWLTLLHGYYACISYNDAQIGRLLHELEKEGLESNTIIILWGDHGYQLTEHGMWSKRNTLHVSINAPLIISIPGKTNGTKTKKLVEFIDLYPSLAELAGLPLPGHLQGKSFVPLIENPDMEWKEAAFTRCGKAETIITEKYVYTEWQNDEKEIYQRMLFNRFEDKQENNNLAYSSEYQETIAELSEQLNKHIETR